MLNTIYTGFANLIGGISNVMYSYLLIILLLAVGLYFTCRGKFLQLRMLPESIRVASEKAKFGQPEVGLGITPGFSGTQRLPRRVGIAKAKELIFSGKTIGAQEAKEIGLVNAVYAPEELLNGAIAMAQSFTANAPIAVKYSKACIDRGMQMDIDDGIALENELFAMCYATADQKEGMGAFLEKRKEKHFQNK